MLIKELERIALKSHGGTLAEKPGEITPFSHYEENLRIPFSDRVRYLHELYPQEPILVVHLGGEPVPLPNVDDIPIETFGIDKNPFYYSTNGIPISRYIKGDVSTMANIPDGTFHYGFSYNSLGCREIDIILHEIYRVLKPGGIAETDVEHWYSLYLDVIRKTNLEGSLILRAPNTGVKKDVEEMFALFQEGGILLGEEYDDLYDVILELRKPIG